MKGSIIIIILELFINWLFEQNLISPCGDGWDIIDNDRPIFDHSRCVRIVIITKGTMGAT